MIDVDVEKRLGSFHLSVAFRAEAPVVGLFGRSGAGKTSVVNAIAGIVKPDHGFIRINGQTLFDSARRLDLRPEDRRIGYVFQEPLLFPHLDVEANLLYGHRLRRPADRFIDEGRVIELLGLGALLGRKISALSGGERQRIAIGRALLAQPRLLLLDEPLASLDVPRKIEILEYVERLRDEVQIPIVYVSHSIPEVTRLADTVVVLSGGKCLAAGDTDAVMGRIDLKPATGRYEAGVLIESQVVEHDGEGELTTLAFDGGTLIVPKIGAAVGERVRARIRARDVSLALQRPSQISILNVLSGRVTSIGTDRGGIVEVQVAVGAAVINARITRRSLRELQVRVGQDIYVLVKAVSFDQRSVGYA